MVRSDGRRRPVAWALVRRLTAAGAVVAVAVLSTGGAAAPPATLTSALIAPEGTGLSDWPGWAVRDPAEQQLALATLLLRERQAVVVPAAVPAPSTTAPAPPAPPPAPPAGPAPTLPGDGTVLVGPEAVATALKYALAQLGKPYVWGAEGPDTYDCSGLTMSAYAAAGVLLPRTSVLQAQVGSPVGLADLLPGDLVFWAYFPSDLSTVHHVALYLGGGMVVHAPQAGDVVRVAPLWLSGYAGAVRVAGGPATATLPSPPPGGVDPTTLPPGSVPPGMVPPGTVPPGTVPPGTTTPGTTPPGTTPPGTTPPGTTPPGTTPPGNDAAGNDAAGNDAAAEHAGAQPVGDDAAQHAAGDDAAGHAGGHHAGPDRAAAHDAAAHHAAAHHAAAHHAAAHHPGADHATADHATAHAGRDHAGERDPDAHPDQHPLSPPPARAHGARPRRRPAARAAVQAGTQARTPPWAPRLKLAVRSRASPWSLSLVHGKSSATACRVAASSSVSPGSISTSPRSAAPKMVAPARQSACSSAWTDTWSRCSRAWMACAHSCAMIR